MQLICRIPSQMTCRMLGPNLNLLARLTCCMPSQLTCRMLGAMRSPGADDLSHTLAADLPHVGSQSKSPGAADVPHALIADVLHVGCHEVSRRS